MCELDCGIVPAEPSTLFIMHFLVTNFIVTTHSLYENDKEREKFVVRKKNLQKKKRK